MDNGTGQVEVAVTIYSLLHLVTLVVKWWSTSIRLLVMDDILSSSTVFSPLVTLLSLRKLDNIDRSLIAWMCLIRTEQQS